VEPFVSNHSARCSARIAGRTVESFPKFHTTVENVLDVGAAWVRKGCCVDPTHAVQLRATLKPPRDLAVGECRGYVDRHRGRASPLHTDMATDRVVDFGGFVDASHAVVAMPPPPVVVLQLPQCVVGGADRRAAILAAGMMNTSSKPLSRTTRSFATLLSATPPA